MSAEEYNEWDVAVEEGRKLVKQIRYCQIELAKLAYKVCLADRPGTTGRPPKEFQGQTVANFAEQVGISYSALNRWIQIYKHEMKVNYRELVKKKSFTEEDQKAIVKRWKGRKRDPARTHTGRKPSKDAHASRALEKVNSALLVIKTKDDAKEVSNPVRNELVIKLRQFLKRLEDA